MAVAENGLDGQLLVQCHAHGQGHFAGLGIAHQDNGGALLGHADALTGGELRAGSLDGQIAAGTLGQPHDSLHGVLILAVDDAVGAQLHGLVQALLHDVHHIDLADALSLQGHHGHEADAACTHDHGGLARMGAALVGSVEAHGQRLNEGALQGGDILRQLEAQVGLMGHVLLEHAVHGRRCKEHHIGAEVIPAGSAELAVSAGFAGLQCHPVAHLQVLHILADLHHNAAGLMAQDKGRFHDEVADGAGFIVVHVTAADAHILQLHQHFVCLGRGDGTGGVAHFADAFHHRDLHIAVHIVALLYRILLFRLSVFISGS